MAKKRQLQFGAINITMPAPHSPDRYVQLFQQATALEKVVKLRGDWVGRLGELRVEQDGNDLQIVRGEFYKYIELDSTRDWFNVLKGKPAEERELESIQIPEHLKPHFQYVPFVFYPRRHRLIMITRDGHDVISVAQAALILRAVFMAPKLMDAFGKMEIVIEPSRDTLEKIFSMPRLRKLEITVTPPNPDDFEEFEHDLFEEMSNQRAGSYQVVMHEADGQGLIPGDRIKKLARVAQSNGKVSGTSGPKGKMVEMSTTDHPLVEKAQYDPNVEMRVTVLLTKAKEIFQQLKG